MSKTKEITYVDYQKKLDNILKLVEKTFSSENSQLLKKYDRELVNSSIAVSTRGVTIQYLKLMTDILNKNWKDVTKDDIDSLVYTVMEKHGRNGQETNTTQNCKRTLKPFIRWLKTGIREYKQIQREGIIEPIEIRRIVMKPVKSKMTKEDLLTDKERANMLSACNGDPRNRALFAVLDEAGTRAGEALTRQIKHVRKDEYGIVLSVDGKTGTRPIRLIKSAPILSQWLNVHPLNNDPEAALFIKTRKHEFGEHLGYFGARAVIVKLAEEAEIPKRVYMHLLRHTAATQTSSFLNEQQQKIRYGWGTDSKMPNRYEHFNNEDVDNALLEHHGIETSAKKSKPDTPKICQTCNEPNPHDSKFCNNCSRPLDLETAAKIEEEKTQENIKTNLEIVELRKEVALLSSLVKKNNETRQLTETKVLN